MNTPSPMFTVVVCILLVMILSRIRIVRVPVKKSDIDRHEGNGDNSELIITGYMDKLREIYPNMSDIDILNKSSKDFHSIFEEAVKLYMQDKVKVDNILNIQVFFDWTDKNLLVSKAVAKTEEGEAILERMNAILNKKNFS